MKLYEGCVENRSDPLKLGRCQVRVVGLHTHDKSILPTADLPWAYPLQPVTSAGISGLGYAPIGLVEGSWVLITFRDDDEQQPIILGSVGGIPQDKSIVFDVDDDTSILKNETTGDLEAVPLSSDSTPEIIEKAETPQEQVLNSSPCQNLSTIPTKAPSDITRNTSQVQANIKVIIDECCAAGFTKEQTASLLGIIGGECGFIPKNEDYEYKDPNYLMSIFKTSFNGNLELAIQYSKWRSQNKGTIAEFFEFVYGSDKKIGKGIGNTQPGDGGKYYGRGLLQITGRENYEKYAASSRVDIVNNPDLLNTNIQASAKIAVQFFQQTVKNASPTAHPGYFNAAKQAVNPYDNPEKKIRYYEYFYGQDTPENIEEKTTDAPAPEGQASVPNTPSPSRNPIIGFKDPNNKYPLKSKVFEQDTNRLARGVSTGTIVDQKNSRRIRNIPKALGKGSYNEPPAPFASRYPFNHVFESESGHVQEFDDTPGFERTHFYHRKGTFTEVDANGSEVHHIVGDSYHITERNGSVYIQGECNITVDGDTNIFCRTDANIEVSGDAKMKVGGDFDIGVAENMTVAVGGTLSLFSRGNMNLNTQGQFNLVASNDLKLKSGGETHVQASKFHADAVRVDFNSGTSSSASTVTLNPPSVGNTVNNVFPYLVAPDQDDELLSTFETPEDWATPAGIAALKKLEEKYPVEDVETKDSAQPRGQVTQTVPASCDVIFATEDFASDFRLSENFTLGMMFDGGFNNRHKLRDQVGLTKQQIVCNLSQLCQNVLEKYVSILPGGMAGYGKEWRISSGFRNGSNSSQHNKGQAVDIALGQGTKNRKEATYNLAQEMEKLVPYDQIIVEYRGTSENWIHTSYDGSGKNRKMAFTMLNDKTYPKPGAKGFYLL
jgi:predicted chitinase